MVISLAQVELFPLLDLTGSAGNTPFFKDTLTVSAPGTDVEAARLLDVYKWEKIPLA